MIPKFQRGTRSYSNTSFLQCAANGLALCSRKGRTMIKVMGVGEWGGGGGGGSYKKKKNARENLSEKNSCMQSRPEKKKNGLPHILHSVSQEGMQESILCAKHQLFE